jgi:hypothetical protein
LRAAAGAKKTHGEIAMMTNNATFNTPTSNAAEFAMVGQTIARERQGFVVGNEILLGHNGMPAGFRGALPELKFLTNGNANPLAVAPDTSGMGKYVTLGKDGNEVECYLTMDPVLGSQAGKPAYLHHKGLWWNAPAAFAAIMC